MKQIEDELRALVRAGVLEARDGRVTFDESFGLSCERGFDAAQLTLDLEARTASLWTASVSHHNGDYYGEKIERVEWGAALGAAYPEMRMCARGWLWKKRAEEKEAREKAEFEAAYRKLVDEPGARTFFDRLLEG